MSKAICGLRSFRQPACVHGGWQGLLLFLLSPPQWTSAKCLAPDGTIQRNGCGQTHTVCCDWGRKISAASAPSVVIPGTCAALADRLLSLHCRAADLEHQNTSWYFSPQGLMQACTWPGEPLGNLQSCCTPRGGGELGLLNLPNTPAIRLVNSADTPNGPTLLNLRESQPELTATPLKHGEAARIKPYASWSVAVPSQQQHQAQRYSKHIARIVVPRRSSLLLSILHGLMVYSVSDLCHFRAIDG